MKTNKTKSKQNWSDQQIQWVKGLTKNKYSLQILILFNFVWSIASLFADWNWFSQIPIELVPLTAICSLYPPLLTIWYFIKYNGKTPPGWLTFWIFVGITSYGIMAQIYFPLLMSWKGVNFHSLGSMFWVAFYGLQAFIIFDYLKPLKIYQYLIFLGYFILVDSMHYFYPTFVDFTLPGYPIWIRDLTAQMMISLQILSIITALVIMKKKHHKNLI
ncbi:hypothetical protein GF376_03540 [Candidatus Peregrinibacteria bacterium]|nr:hypothetical protein [Candidatus Peregrinibacteria bacterium]